MDRFSSVSEIGVYSLATGLFFCYTVDNLSASETKHDKSQVHISKGLKVKQKKSDAVLTKERLLEIITRLLETKADLGFLVKMDQTELETLVACVRDRLDRIHE